VIIDENEPIRIRTSRLTKNVVIDLVSDEEEEEIKKIKVVEQITQEDEQQHQGVVLMEVEMSPSPREESPSK
jgi:hypothetical protein